MEQGTFVERAARMTYEVNRSYCQTIGDHSFVPWDQAPEWQKKASREGVLFHVKAIGEGRDPKPWESHESWLKAKEADGWKYGPVKDAEKKEHPCFVPYHELPFEQRVKDYLFAAVVRGLFDAEKSR